MNQVGGNDELIFDGHSLALRRRMAIAGPVRRDFDEDFVVVDVVRSPS